VETVNLQDAAEGKELREGTPASAMKRDFPLGHTRLFFPLLLVFLVFLAFLSAPYIDAQQPRPTESQVKAAYLFNFGKFVRWPPLSGNQSEPLEICVLGKNPFGLVLDATVKGETINGRPVDTRTILSLHEAEGCRILFVSMSEEGHLNAILAGARHLPALTVSDIPHFAERGGMIGLVSQEDRIRFEVNIAPVADADLAVSSELLKVALKVIRKNGGGD
jgi:hypothetical protein